MIVDVHAHGLSEDFIIETAKGPGRDWKVEIAGPRHYVAAHYGPLDPLLYDLEERLASLRSRRVVLQLICPPPPLVATREHAADVALTQRLNKSTAKLVADGEGLLAGVAVPAIGEPARAADELREAVEKHGFVGVMLPSSAGDQPLDDPAFAPLFAAIEHMKLFAFMHPTGFLFERWYARFHLADHRWLADRNQHSRDGAYLCRRAGAASRSQARTRARRRHVALPIGQTRSRL
jgi:aminocarboxymuconate-semialdehyde decarboxylase